MTHLPSAEDKLRTFLDADKLELSAFLADVNDFITLPKDVFLNGLRMKKAKKSASDHIKKLEAFRQTLAENIKVLLRVPESQTLVKRSTVDGLVTDIYFLAYAFINKSHNEHTAVMFDGLRSIAQLTDEIRASVMDNPKVALLKILELVIKSQDEVNSLKKSLTKACSRIKELEDDKIVSNGKIEQLLSSLGSFKYNSVRAQVAANVQPPLPPATPSATKKRKAGDDDVVELPQQSAAGPDFEPVDTNPNKWLTQGSKKTAAYLFSQTPAATPRAANKPLSKPGNNKNNQNSNNNRFYSHSGSNSAVRNMSNNQNANRQASNNQAKRSARSGRGGYIVGNQSGCSSSGDGENQINVRAAVRRFHFYLGKWDVLTESDDIRAYVKSRIGCDLLDIQEISYTHRFFRSYRVIVEDTFNESMLNPANWPRNVLVGRFFYPKTEQRVRFDLTGNKSLFAAKPFYFTGNSSSKSYSVTAPSSTSKQTATPNHAVEALPNVLPATESVPTEAAASSTTGLVSGMLSGVKNFLISSISEKTSSTGDQPTDPVNVESTSQSINNESSTSLDESLSMQS